MTRLLVAVTSLCLAATLGLVALASTGTHRRQGSSSAAARPVDLQSSPSARRSPSVSPAPTPAAGPASTTSPAPAAPDAPSTPEIHPKAVTKSLSIDYQAQVNSYWCAPAATRIALSSKVDTLPNQAALATDLGTTEGGTDSILQVVGGLNKLLAGTGTQYVTRDWSNHPMTPEMTQQLWSDTVRDIDDGKAIVANIVATPSNQPSHYPPGQTFYHYVTITGYNAANKTVHIADPGDFSGIEQYWLDLDQMASLIQPKGYAA